MMPTVLINNLWYLGLGALNTIGIAAASIALSAALGLLLAVLHLFGGVAARLLVELYLYIVRGVPLLVLLFTVYYVLPYSGVALGAVEGGILVLGLYFAAFMSEAFRAAILSLPKAQWDAARGLGMRRSLMLRIVIFPQALRVALPPFVNTCLMLIKSTSLVSIIGIWELTAAGREVTERTFAAFQIFGGVALIYFCICYSLAQLSRHLEERFRYVH
jgi:His/Glu/Gln/Arg/opine family amino acid ABC transporter permease subunit